MQCGCARYSSTRLKLGASRWQYLGEQRLARPREPVQQDAARRLAVAWEELGRNARQDPRDPQRLLGPFEPDDAAEGDAAVPLWIVRLSSWRIVSSSEGSGAASCC